MTVAYLGLGSNLGDRRAQLDRAVDAIAAWARVTARSSWIVTAPVGYQQQADFVNGALAIETGRPAAALLAALKTLEVDLGRLPTFPDGPREIDLDLLFYGDEIIEEPGLVVPHPRLHERRFVLEPLCELAPDLVHPVLGSTLSELLAALPQSK